MKQIPMTLGGIEKMINKNRLKGFALCLLSVSVMLISLKSIGPVHASFYQSRPKDGGVYDSLTSVQIITPVTEDLNTGYCTFAYEVRWFLDETPTGGLLLEVAEGTATYIKWSGTIENPCGGYHQYTFRVYWRKIHEATIISEWEEDVFGNFSMTSPYNSIPADGGEYEYLTTVQIITIITENLVTGYYTYAYEVRWFLDETPGGLLLEVAEETATYRRWSGTIENPSAGLHDCAFRVYWRKIHEATIIDEWEEDVSLTFTRLAPQPTSPNILTLGPAGNFDPGDCTWDGGNIMPYVCGFQEGEDEWGESYSQTDKFRITVSFPNTPPPGQTIQDVIPEDNYVAGGMFLQGQENSLGIDRTDYGFLASLSLDHDGILKYNMAFYKTHEPLHWAAALILYGWPPQPEGADYEIPWKSAIIISSVDPSEPITLTMQWNAGWVEWFYTIGSSTYFAGIYNAEGYSSTIIKKFFVGTRDAQNTWGNVVLACYSQFGVYSKTRIENTGWNVRLENPQYYTSDNQWKRVSTTTSNDGTVAYLDNWWKWGGLKYNGANGRYYENGELQEACVLEIYWRDPRYYDDLVPGTLLWDMWRDVAVTQVTASPTSVIIGDTVTITVSVENQGDCTETFDVVAYYDSTAIATQTVANLAPGDYTTLDFDWGTIGVPVGTYTVKATASTVPDETDTADNTYVDDTVTVNRGSPPGGCPILSVYDGTEYVLEGLLDIHNPDEIDQIASHVLIHTPEPVEHRYLLRLTEHPQTYSHLDQVQLFAMLTNGTEVKLPLVSAVHSEDGNVKQELLVSDDVRAVMLGENWNNGTSQYIDLKFVVSDQLEIETFTFIIEGHNRPLKIP
ncbi:MAG: hypothetical protein JSV15_02715 [Candidatus Bathyarchaeota archaeon]|nr:MAG: hypothetical protein JSV15_02715 [Candidatus Bathyarchaeota archaeon]